MGPSIRATVHDTTHDNILEAGEVTTIKQTEFFNIYHMQHKNKPINVILASRNIPPTTARQ